MATNWWNDNQKTVELDIDQFSDSTLVHVFDQSSETEVNPLNTV